MDKFSAFKNAKKYIDNVVLTTLNIKFTNSGKAIIFVYEFFIYLDRVFYEFFSPFFVGFTKLFKLSSKSLR